MTRPRPPIGIYQFGDVNIASYVEGKSGKI